MQSPQGSDPLPPGLSSPLLQGGGCGAPILDSWEGATLLLSPTRWSCRPVEWGWVGAWQSGSDTVPTTRAAGRASLSCPSGTPASPASAPGVPGGSASAETVTPLPGAVDEGQGILELLVGGFLDGLVGEVHLVDGIPPTVQCRQESVQF